MINAGSEMVWKGRTHLGDEPGVYGNADYPGLSAEWPLTLVPLDPTSSSMDVSLQIECEGVAVYSPYPGHAVEIRNYVPDPVPNNPYKFAETSIGSARLTTDALTVVVPGPLPSGFLSVQIRVDTTVKPGLYDDFVVIGISLKSTTHYAKFGF